MGETESPKDTTHHRSACTECQRRKQKVFESPVAHIHFTIPFQPAASTTTPLRASCRFPRPETMPQSLLSCSVQATPPKTSHLTVESSAIENGHAITARNAKSPTSAALARASPVRTRLHAMISLENGN
ncbi:hypothetical protein VCV18_006570 [Metarhizium anisopliae]